MVDAGSAMPLTPSPGKHPMSTPMSKLELAQYMATFAVDKASIDLLRLDWRGFCHRATFPLREMAEQGEFTPEEAGKAIMAVREVAVTRIGSSLHAAGESAR